MANDALRDGFVRLCFDASLNLLGTKSRMVLEGQFYDDGGGAAVTADTLVKVTSAADIDVNFGAGSVLGESLKKAITCCGNDGVELFALPRADAAGAVSAEYTLTVTGPATSAGRVDIYGGDSGWNISVYVADGTSANDIATAIQAAFAADFPYSSAVAANVITFTARNGGTVGNFLNFEVNWHGRNGYMPDGVTVTAAQTVVGSVDPVSLDYETVFGECCVAALGMLYGDVTWQTGADGYLSDAWACDKPQCFGHGYTYNSGTIGAILATDTNSPALTRLAHDASDANFPWLKIASYTAKSACLTVDNPEISVQGPNFGVLDCVRAPESCSSPWTFDEQEQLRDSGFVVTVPVSGGEGALTSPMVTNDITNNRFDDEGRENLTFKSVSSRRLATATAVAIALQLKQFNGLGYFSANTSIGEGAIGVNKNVMLGTMRAWAKQNVGILFSEFENLNEDLTFQDDFDVAPRCQGVPGKVYMNMVYRPPVRLQSITVNAAPKLLNNC